MLRVRGLEDGWTRQDLPTVCPHLLLTQRPCSLPYFRSCTLPWPTERQKTISHPNTPRRHTERGKALVRRGQSLLPCVMCFAVLLHHSPSCPCGLPSKHRKENERNKAKKQVEIILKERGKNSQAVWTSKVEKLKKVMVKPRSGKDTERVGTGKAQDLDRLQRA